MQKTLRIKNDIHELSMMNQFLEEAGEELGLSTAFMMSLNLVMEEAVSNIIFYAYKGDAERGRVPGGVQRLPFFLGGRTGCACEDRFRRTGS